MMGAALATLIVWIAFVEIEMPERTNECPYVEEACEEEVVE